MLILLGFFPYSTFLHAKLIIKECILNRGCVKRRFGRRAFSMTNSFTEFI